MPSQYFVFAQSTIPQHVALSSAAEYLYARFKQVYAEHTMITRWLSGFSMYKVVLVALSVLAGSAFILGDVIGIDRQDFILQTILLLILCWFVNQCIARVVGTKPNIESQYITALILTFLITPGDVTQTWPLMLVASIAAMGSKYLLVWRKRHIFNPAAAGVLITYFVLGEGASWWVSSPAIIGIAAILGALIVTKIRRWDVVGSFLGTYFLGILVINGGALSQIVTILTVTPIIFFAMVMLVEPMTSPADKPATWCYGVGTGLALVLIQRFFPDITYSLELVLLLANASVSAFRHDRHFVMTLTKKEPLADNTIGYWFDAVPPVAFRAGQYLEWSLPHLHADARGIRRYFTIASSPTESQILVATRHAKPSSSFKHTLHALKLGDTVTAFNLGGSFTLSAKSEKCVFIAGGIGITPFRSHIKWLVDSKSQDFDIVLLYSNKTKAEIAFKDQFGQAARQLPLRVVYALTEEKPANWDGISGYIDEQAIRQHVPDFAERLFYISGPEPMVQAFEAMLTKMGIKKSRIKRDFFPGYTDSHAA